MDGPIRIEGREPADPTRTQAVAYWARLQANRARRGVKNLLGPVRWLDMDDPASFPHVVAESRTPLWSETDPRERRLQIGKVQNLRLAARAIDRVMLPLGKEFSFWAQVGMPSKYRGYVPGRQIQEGCVVPAIAGGICQLSNALYDVALRAGLEVTERHAHTRSLPRASWSSGRDATVAWNHVDLRLRAPFVAMLRARLTSDELVVQVLAQTPVNVVSATTNDEAQVECESCETCGMSNCWRHKAFDHSHTGTTNAWLVDQVLPEFAEYLSAQGCDALFLPMKGRPRYAWPLGAARHTYDEKWFALRRSRVSRRLAEQGAARQTELILLDWGLAFRYAGRLRFDATHLVVAQTLLPYLWAMGALGGRTYDVLMVRRPIRAIHKALDDAHARHPERKLLVDFRATEEHVRIEEEALDGASRIITPHPLVARSFGSKALLLDWRLPEKKGIERGDNIVFCGPTVARKGAYELRDAVRQLGFPLRYCGSLLEGSDFWNGIDAKPAEGGWLSGANVVVQPSVLEDQPRKLLRAIAEGVPVIATESCGVSHLPGVITVPVGDVDALRDAIRNACRS